MRSYIVEFERITKYPLTSFLDRVQFFLSNSCPELDRFFSGKKDSISNNDLQELKDLLIEFENLLSTFKGFANKFSNLGYWHLLEYLENIQVEIEKVSKLPKFRRTSLTLGNYKQVIQFQSTIGALRTPEDLSNTLTEDPNNWYNYTMNNDIQEMDWDIDTLKRISGYIPTSYIVVSTILDQPIGKRIYGVDINRKVDFENNDLMLVYYEDNVNQKSDILLGLTRGDVPEYMNFGKNLEIGQTVAQFSLPILIKDLSNSFLQNDLFDTFSVSKFSYTDGGQMQIECDIKTKYDYKTERSYII